MDFIRIRDKILAAFGEVFYFRLTPVTGRYKQRYSRLFPNKQHVMSIYQVFDFGNIFSLINYGRNQQQSLIMVFTPNQRRGAPMLMITVANAGSKVKVFFEYFNHPASRFPEDKLIALKEKYNDIPTISGRGSWNIPERKGYSLLKQSDIVFDLEKMLIRAANTYGRELIKWGDDPYDDFLISINRKLKSTRNVCSTVLSQSVGRIHLSDFVDRFVLPPVPLEKEEEDEE